VSPTIPNVKKQQGSNFILLSAIYRHPSDVLGNDVKRRKSYNNEDENAKRG
jgi:hypothetical protein